jgi:hypothetical protein
MGAYSARFAAARNIIAGRLRGRAFSRVRTPRRLHKLRWDLSKPTRSCGSVSATGRLVVASPDSGEVPRQAPRLHHHDVESHRHRGEVGANQQKRLGGAYDAPALAGRQRRGSGGEVGTRLDLDDRQDTAPARQDVDLASRAAPITGENAPAAQS